MSNSLAGINLAQIAQRSLDTLVAQLPALNAFATDFSDEVAVEGSSVTTRVATQPTVGSLATGYSANAQNSTSTAKTITMGDVSGLVLGFTDSEWSKSSINLYDLFIRPGINAVANGMIDDALALLTASNFSSSDTIAAAAMNHGKVVDLAKTLTEANVPKMDRFLGLAPGHYAALAKDVKDTYAVGTASVIQMNQLPPIAGLSVFEYTDIPDNSENLVGWAGGKQGIIIAARQPAIPQGFPGEVQTAVDPDSGFALQLRKWYSADDGKYYLSMGAMWGVAVGVPGNIVRIVSA